MSEKLSKKPSGAQNRKKSLQRENSKRQLAGFMKKFIISPKLNENTKRPRFDNSVSSCTSSSPPTENKSKSTSIFSFQENNVLEFEKENFNTPEKDSNIMETSQEVNTEEDTNSSSQESNAAVTVFLSLSEVDNKEEKHDETVESNTTLNFNANDPGTWPNYLTSKMIDCLVENSPKQIVKTNFPADKSGRKFSESYYSRTLSNGQKVKRNYLIYSETKNSVFCYCCKIFGGIVSQFTNENGCSDWSHLSYLLKKHEGTSAHMKNNSKYNNLKMALSKSITIDSTQQRLYEAEKKHWQSVIERLIYLIQYLSKQCLAFRGSSNSLYENDNGNYLKLIETISKFDPVMAEHLHRIQTSDKRITHYLGDKIQNEIIQIISDAIKNKILGMIKESKYYSLILDTTPDISHTEQLTIIIRFVYPNKNTNKMEIQEHFLGFQSVEDTTGQGFFDFIINYLKSWNIDIADMRGQAYDNGANMRGKHNGLQQKILKVNSRAFFVPCAAHSLNLVVNDAAKISFETVNFFGIVQELYNFFSASVKRWAILKTRVLNLNLKPLSNTRWESRIDAIRPLKNNIREIYQALLDITGDGTKDADSRVQADNLISKICSFKFICSIIIWHNILSLVNVSSKMMQDPKLNLDNISDNLESLLKDLKKLRTDGTFESIIEASKQIASELEIQPIFPEPRKRIKKRLFEYEAPDEVIRDSKIYFKTQFFFAVLDTAIKSVQERFELLKNHNDNFKFISELNKVNEWDDENLFNHCQKTDTILTDKQNSKDRDIDGTTLFEELKTLRPFIKNGMSSHEILNYIHENNLSDIFPNTDILLRIYLTIPISVATGERSFSKLKLIKNYLRSTMSQERLSNLSLISIESDIMDTLEVKDLIKNFVAAKARKVVMY